MKLSAKVLVATGVMAAALGSAQATALAAPAHAAVTAQVTASTPAAVSPDTAHECGYSTGGEAEICIEIVGSGLYVDDMSAEMYNINSSSADYFAAITGPDNFQNIGPVVFMNPGEHYTKTWIVDKDLPAGTYTATLFEWNSYVEEWFAIASTQATVHT